MCKTIGGSGSVATVSKVIHYDCVMEQLGHWQYVEMSKVILAVCHVRSSPLHGFENSVLLPHNGLQMRSRCISPCIQSVTIKDSTRVQFVNRSASSDKTSVDRCPM